MIELTLFEPKILPIPLPSRKILINPTLVQYVHTQTLTATHYLENGNVEMVPNPNFPNSSGMIRKTTSVDCTILNFMPATEEETGYVTVTEPYNVVKKALLWGQDHISDFTAWLDAQKEGK